MTLIGMDTVVVRNPDLPEAPVDDDLIILDVARGHYVGLDAIGREIWDGLASPITLADLCAKLSRRFNASVETIAQDVAVFIRELLDQGLISIQAESGAMR
jgi:hypothetical protein